MTTPVPASLWHFLSREVALVCDASGTLTWADDRAGRMLEAQHPGADVPTLVRVLEGARDGSDHGYGLVDRQPTASRATDGCLSTRP